MGGFIYVARTSGDDEGSIRSELRSSIRAMEVNGLRVVKELETAAGRVLVFGKARAAAENHLDLGSRGFVVATGTFFYRGMMGGPALRRFFEDFGEQGDLFEHLVGQYAVLIQKDGRLQLFNDLAGTHHLFRDRAGKVYSSSFLAVALAMGRRTIDPQGLYEYLADGATYEESTFLNEVRRLDSDHIHVLEPVLGAHARRNPYRPLDASLSFEEMVEEVHGALVAYAELLQRHFGGSMSMALSGGFDSRHLLALLRACGEVPYLYVYGPPSSPDVQISLEIGRGEGLTIHHLDKGTVPLVPAEEYRPLALRQLVLYDGRGAAGAFDNGGDLHSRELRTGAGRLQINGNCGEIFRNVFFLPNRAMLLSEFVNARYDWFEWSLFTEAFRRHEYLKRIERKIGDAISVTSEYLSRQDIERIYPRIRMRYTQGPVVSANNTQSFAVGPFFESRLVALSSGIPYELKDLGRFHAALIRRADPALARYRTVYGHDLSGRYPLGVRVKNWAMLHSHHAPKNLMKSLKNRPKKARVLPRYLTEPYVEAVVGEGPYEVSRWIHLDRIAVPSLLSRAFNVEMVLRGGI